MCSDNPKIVVKRGKRYIRVPLTEIEQYVRDRGERFYCENPEWIVNATWTDRDVIRYRALASAVIVRFSDSKNRYARKSAKSLTELMQEIGVEVVS